MAEVCCRQGEVEKFRLPAIFETGGIDVCALAICIEVVEIIGSRKSKRGSGMA